MTTTEESQKQIKQYKDFTTLTSIRKATQQAIAPTVKSLELQLSALMDDNKVLNKRVSKLDDVFKAQSFIQQRLDQTNKIIRDFKDEQAIKRKQDQRKAAKIQIAIQKLILQMHSQSKLNQSQDQVIKQMNNRNAKNSQMFTNLNTSNQKFTKQIQYKYSDFTRQILDSTKQMKKDYHIIQGQMEGMRQTFRLQRQAIQQKSKPLELYFSERQSMNDKFDDIYLKILNSVTKQDFDNYRKSQKVIIDEHIAAIKNQIQQVLPLSLRNLFPTVQRKMKQVQKIKIIQKNFQDLQRNLDQTNKKIIQTNTQVQQKLQVLRQETRQQTLKLQTQIETKIKQIEERHETATITVQQKIQQMKIEIQQEMSQMIERQTSEIHKTIQAQVAMTRSMNKNQGAMSSAQYQKVVQYAEEVNTIRQKILGRYKKIEELGQTIDSKIQGYSNKIVKIKSDYELFAENMRKQVSGVIKFRDTFLDRLKDVGKLMSSYAQGMFVITSVLIQNSQEEKNNNISGQQKQSIVFITDYDNIVYQWKPQSEKGWIQYRKQKMQLKQFLKSFMYSLVNFSDEMISNLQFLNWKQHKPSSFFKQRIFMNYTTCAKRINENAHKKRGKSFSFYSTPTNIQNQNLGIIQQVDPIMFVDPTASTKQISKTIDSKARLDRVLEQGNFILTNQQNKRIYSIKKAKPYSGRLKTKDKQTHDMNRYDQTFLTSRSACRSRISQLI